jgi:hypothetical protein
MRRLALLIPLLLLACVPASAHAVAYTPPKGKVWHGVTAGSDIRDFESRTGKHPAIWQHFVGWGTGLEARIDATRRAQARLMYHISTGSGQDLPERISPGEIARGEGDPWLLGIARGLAAFGSPAYIRLMGEMNNCHNPYSSYNCSGSKRDRDHSAATFKLAWKRVHLILHGGPIAAIDARLAQLGLPPVRAGATELPRPEVAFVWAPMTGGAPNIGALRPRAYWPGRKWVDGVGTSFYSRFPNFSGLNRFYKDFAQGERKPFAIGEWAIWGSDAPAFADQLFDWIAAHKRTQMVQYNQGAEAGGIFRLSRYPASQRVVRRRIAHGRYLGYAPEFR